MFDEHNIDGVLVEDNTDTHVSTLNKSSFQQLKLSYHSSPNSTSQFMLQDVLQKHIDSFTNKGLPQVVKCAEFLTKNKGKENMNSWKCNLSSFTNPLTLFKRNINCQDCSTTRPDYVTTSITTNMCKCNLKHEPETQPTKHLNQEQKPLYVPRFNRTKSKTQFTQPSTSKADEVFVEKDVEEENRNHKSQVAKLTFKTAKEQLLSSNPAAKRTLGASRKAQSKFISPMISAQDKQEEANEKQTICDERLKHLDPKMIELIESEIMDQGAAIGWDDIAGLDMAKSVIQEAVVWPLLRPDIFTGLRRPPKGILLFGPPGTGKTLIGKCVASQCNATFFNISASSLTSKWIGDGEKMVRALFAVAKCHQPAVIFIDEIDSLLTQRSDSEHEATRRIKTEFLVQFDGAHTEEEDRLLIVGATNRPQELDEAARRRLVKRLYIPLPDLQARKQIITNLLNTERNDLTDVEKDEVARLADGYSGADMKSLCSEAAMGPIRTVLSQIVTIQRDKVRPVNIEDFKAALQRVRPSVSQDDLGQYVKWNKTYGQGF